MILPLTKEVELHLTLDTEQEVHFLQFFALFSPQVEAVEELSRVILSVNSGIDMGGFGLYENDRLFYYRTLWTFKTFDETLFDVHIDAISFLIETFLPSMLEIASGKLTVEKVRMMEEIGSLP